ncbi:MAG: 30S ribosome-binding factor RbfA [Actinomycetota bacterium]
MDRTKKLEIDIKREISFIINELVKDPRVGFTTVTDTILSSDHKYLDIYISVLNGQAGIKRSMEGLEKSSGFIKRKLKERVELRNIPVLRFKYDESIDKGMRISGILEKLKKNKDVDG